MIGNRDGVFDPKSINVVGGKVAIWKKDVDEDIDHGGLVVPSEILGGSKGVEGIVISIGDDAVEWSGLSVGDEVKFDHCGIFWDSHPVVILNVENVIVKLIDGEHTPLKNHVFVEKIGCVGGNDQGGVLIPEINTVTELGEVVKVDNESIVKVGDTVLMTTRCDCIHAAGGDYWIYPNDDIQCTVDELTIT